MTEVACRRRGGRGVASRSGTGADASHQQKQREKNRHLPRNSV